MTWNWKPMIEAPTSFPILATDGESIMVVRAIVGPRKTTWFIADSFGFNEDGECHPTEWDYLPPLPNGKEYTV